MQIPFHVADPTGPLAAELIAADRVALRPEILRHFAARLLSRASSIAAETPRRFGGERNSFVSWPA